MKIDLTGVKAQLLDIAERNMKEALEYVKDEVDSKTPEDTKTLLGNNTIEPIIKLDTKIVGVVSNDTEYAPYVEFGVGRNYNYNKPKGTIFYSGNGARMFTRTADSQQVQEDLTIILNK